MREIKQLKWLANAAEGKNFIETVWGRGYVLREGAPPMPGHGMDEEMLRIA